MHGEVYSVVNKTEKHRQTSSFQAIDGVCRTYVLLGEGVLAVAEYTDQHSTELVTLYPGSVWQPAEIVTANILS